MIKITFVSHDGRKVTVDARDGDSVMQTALTKSVGGIVGECGGSMMCATCHCYVDEAWLERAGVRSDSEDEILDSAVAEIRPTSRLSCQISVRPELDGLVIHLPAAQQ